LKVKSYSSNIRVTPANPKKKKKKKTTWNLKVPARDKSERGG